MATRSGQATPVVALQQAIRRFGGLYAATGLVALIVGITLRTLYLTHANMNQMALAATTPAPGLAPSQLKQMVQIPGGAFIMGTNNPHADTFERPAHIVNLAGFYISKYPVTMKQYQQFVNATGYPPPPGWKNGHYPQGLGGYPVFNVSLYDAAAYAQWAHQCLPTEAQWEKAARGTTGGNYPWGNRWLPRNVNSEYAAGHPTPVGYYPGNVSPYGVYDMSGNVWQWTVSYFVPYPGAPQSQWWSRWKGYVVTRGGSYMSDYIDVRTYIRNPILPTTKLPYIGFRTVSCPASPNAGL